MSNRPAKVTQADIARIIRAAKKEGAAEIEVRMGEASVVVRMESSVSIAEAGLDLKGEIVL